MDKRIIRLCYRKVIESSSKGAWNRLVFEDSYKEFLMQAQFFNQDKAYTTFAQLVAHVPNASQLHFLVSAAVTGYVKQLGGIVPDISNALGRHFLPFSDFRFEIVNSDITDRNRHQVALCFYSDRLRWHDTIGDQLLMSLPTSGAGPEQLTELVSLRPFLSIYSLSE